MSNFKYLGVPPTPSAFPFLCACFMLACALALIAIDKADARKFTNFAAATTTPANSTNPSMIAGQTSPPIIFETPDNRVGYLRCHVEFQPNLNEWRPK